MTPIDVFEVMRNRTNMSLYCQEGIVNTVETRVNPRLQLYGGRRRESGKET